MHSTYKVKIILNLFSVLCLITVSRYSFFFLWKLSISVGQSIFTDSISLIFLMVSPLKGCYGQWISQWFIQILFTLKTLTDEDGPLSWCPPNMYIYLSSITEADDPDMGGGVFPLVSMCFLQT